jgi:DNA-binding GntR family transcriptional regulator
MVREELGEPEVRANEDLAAMAYREIRRAIIDLRFQPGQRLQETYLADWLGTSRTPIREVLKRLRGEGLISSLSSRGAIVSQVSVDDVENAYLVIEVMEALASRLAAERHTDEHAAAINTCLEALSIASEAEDVAAWSTADAMLHDTIRAGAQSEKLDLVAHIMYPTIERTRSMYLLEGREPDRLADSTAAHIALGKAVLEREAELAERLTLALFQQARVNNIRLLKQWIVPLRRSF